MSHIDSALSEEILNVSMAEVKPKIQPHSILDDFRGKPVSFSYILDFVMRELSLIAS